MQDKIWVTWQIVVRCQQKIIILFLIQTNYRQKEKQILDRILDQEVYDSRMRPTGVNSTGLFTALVFNIEWNFIPGEIFRKWHSNTCSINVRSVFILIQT